jgi:hypothetical protein
LIPCHMTAYPYRRDVRGITLGSNCVVHKPSQMA